MPTFPSTARWLFAFLVFLCAVRAAPDNGLGNGDFEKDLLVKRGLFPSARRRKPHAWDLDAETAAEVDRLFANLQRALQ